MLSLIDQLPRNSRYRQALANDEDMARAYLAEFDDDIDDQAPSDDDGRPEMSDFSLEAELLLEVVNELKSLRAEAVGLQTGKAGAKPRFRKGPMTAYERVRYQVREAQHNVLAAMLTPRDEQGRRVQPIVAEPATDPDSMMRDTAII